MSTIECECGRTLEPYTVTVDEEQYVEDLCPRCAFPRQDFPNPDSDTRTLTLEMIDDTMAELNKQGRVGKTLMVSPSTLKKLHEEITSMPFPPLGGPIKLVTGGHSLDIKVTSALPDGEGAIVDSMNDRHPIIPEPKTSAGIIMKHINREIRAKAELFKLLPKESWAKDIGERE